ncbi:hypothetical protein BLA29_000675 [Euroglyphus maynei]|uniref:glutathione-specific gamma-glutamylcyclotransferase n=1 Tax=Euroglyphus maynei TaxID=6958 RepID=A0A1Y3BM69_EURMA|nr:hypothetical protein BLA29_000675 [Euroglyphus maynei]
MTNETVWVFAYGSLIWNPGFEYKKVIIGSIRGYSRRFFQGSDQHRGSPESLGRVATLIEDEQGSTWGLAFLIADDQTALEYLKQRESSIGGYTTIMTTFYPKDQRIKESIQTLVYIALPCNRLFLGPSQQLAIEIAQAKGFCGYNVEYLAKLVAFMKIELPHIVDEHLQQLELQVKQILHRNNPSLLKFFTDAIDLWLNNNVLTLDEKIDDSMKTAIKPILIQHRMIDNSKVPKQQQLRCMIKH